MKMLTKKQTIWISQLKDAKTLTQNLDLLMSGQAKSLGILNLRMGRVLNAQQWEVDGVVH